jgi:hypothetical protein
MPNTKGMMTVKTTARAGPAMTLRLMLKSLIVCSSAGTSRRMGSTHAAQD